MVTSTSAGRLHQANAPARGPAQEATRTGPGYVLLLGAAVGVSAWAYQIYGQGPAHSEHLLQQVLFWAQLPAIIIALRKAAPGPRPAVRATLPSIVVAGVFALLPQRPDVASPGLVAALVVVAGCAYGWLVVGGLAATVLRAPARPWAPVVPKGRLRVALLVEVAGAACAVGVGLSMPATTRGLIEPEQIGMLDQVHALATGYGDPTPTHLVAAYASLLLLTAAGRLVLDRTPRPPEGSGSPDVARATQNIPAPEPHPA